MRTKEEAIAALGFRQVSLLQPSKPLTQTNRCGLPQAFALAVWQKLSPLLIGSLRKFRGVPVAASG